MDRIYRTPLQAALMQEKQFAHRQRVQYPKYLSSNHQNRLKQSSSSKQDYLCQKHLWTKS